MSVDPSTLKKDDKVSFGRMIVKTVNAVDITDPRLGSSSVWLTENTRLAFNDDLWELAELVKPELPDSLLLAHVAGNGRYKVTEHVFTYLPEPLLRMLKRDVEALEAAGVKEEG